MMKKIQFSFNYIFKIFKKKNVIKNKNKLKYKLNII